MTIFVDASALIAGEADADNLADRLEGHADRLCSAVCVWEAVAGLCHSHGLAFDRARAAVDLFVAEAGMALVPIAAAERDLALAAYHRFGRGRHRAALNMGDCFAYACAAANNAALLCKGDDFGHTDLA